MAEPFETPFDVRSGPRERLMMRGPSSLSDAELVAVLLGTGSSLEPVNVLAARVLESSVAAYEVGNVDFLTLLANFITVLNYEINFEEQQARYRQALARLEPLLGAEFIR